MQPKKKIVSSVLYIDYRSGRTGTKVIFFMLIAENSGKNLIFNHAIKSLF